MNKFHLATLVRGSTGREDQVLAPLVKPSGVVFVATKAFLSVVSVQGRSRYEIVGLYIS
jgi:hypothetical protein